jgi:hypothetical protein
MAWHKLTSHVLKVLLEPFDERESYKRRLRRRLSKYVAHCAERNLATQFIVGIIVTPKINSQYMTTPIDQISLTSEELGAI